MLIMNREVLYRGQSLVTKEWLTGRLVVAGADVSNTYCIVKNGDMEMDGHHIRQATDVPLYVDEKTIGEFSGCLDKNGTRIFEGDIVECCSWNEFFSDGSGKPLEPFRRKCVIEFRNGGFKMVEKRKFDYPGAEPVVWDIIFDGDIVVIGNIYDNPELLED